MIWEVFFYKLVNVALYTYTVALGFSITRFFRRTLVRAALTLNTIDIIFGLFAEIYFVCSKERAQKLNL